MGKLKDKDYMFHSEKYVNKEMIEKMVELNPNESQIITQHFISPISVDLRSQTCNTFLRSIWLDANIENLMLDTSQYVIDAIWQDNYNLIRICTLI